MVAPPALGAGVSDAFAALPAPLGSLPDVNGAIGVSRSEGQLQTLTPHRPSFVLAELLPRKRVATTKPERGIAPSQERPATARTLAQLFHEEEFGGGRAMLFRFKSLPG